VFTEVYYENFFSANYVKIWWGGHPIIVHESKDVLSGYFSESWKLWRWRRDRLMSPDQKASRLSSFLSYLMSHCDVSFLSMSGHFPGCRQAARPQWSYPI